MKKLWSFFFPSGVLTLAITGLLLAAASRETLSRFSSTIFFVALAVGLFFTLRFGRSKHFFVVLMLMSMAALSPLLIPAAPAAMTVRQVFYYHCAALLVPLHCGLFAWWRERGLFNAWGLSRLLWILLVVTAVATAGMLPEVLEHPHVVRFFLNGPLPGHPRFPLIPLLVTGLSLAWLLIMYLQDPSPARDGFFWAAVLAAIAFFPQNGPVFFRLAASGAVGVLLISMIETGHFFAYRDELTGLPSRRALNEKLQSLGKTYAIAMVDVDHFKRFNDRYGHDVGDEVLRMVAAALGKAKAGAFRFGGEEFTLVFPGKDMAQAKAEAEQVRVAVSRSSFTIRNPARKKGKTDVSAKTKPGKRKQVSVTVSIGLAQRSSRRPSPEAVLKAADKALYRAKKNGRNRTEIVG